MTFLSALNTPIARRFEIWEPDTTRTQLHLAGGFCESAGSLQPAQGVVTIERGQGTIGKVFLTGVPAVSDNAGTEPASVGPAAAAAGLNSLIAIPVLRDGRLVAAVAWYF
jgi:hypothetical protein